MEFLDEDAKPRFLLQSKQLHQSNCDPDTQTRFFTRPGTIISLSLSLLFFLLSFLYFSFEPFGSIFLWFSLSLLIGPFAPPSITAGDIRVGLGPPIQDPIKEDLSDTEDTKKSNRRSNRPSRKNVDFDPVFATHYDPNPERVNGSVANSKKSIGSVENLEKSNGSGGDLEKSGEGGGGAGGVWSEGDEELLRKMMGKNPVGKPGRWEAIAEGFNGRFKVESVIKKAKELGEKKVSDEDSYQRFLKDRKAVDKRAEGGGNEADFAKKAVVVEGNGWSSGEDLALLNALKTFPKEVAMRWEKVAAAVPGKNKAACMKRMAELKKDFRSSKA